MLSHYLLQGPLYHFYLPLLQYLHNPIKSNEQLLPALKCGENYGTLDTYLQSQMVELSATLSPFYKGPVNCRGRGKNKAIEIKYSKKTRDSKVDKKK